MRDPLDVYFYLNTSGTVPDAVWTDRFSLEPAYMDQMKALAPQADARRALLFAGVSHKGTTTYTSDPIQSELMTRIADPYIDFVTTTGPRTGEAAPLDKVVAMRGALNHAKLAIASGVTPQNIGDYVPYTDAILVASSIEATFGEIDPERLSCLMAAFRVSIEVDRETRQPTS